MEPAAQGLQRFPRSAWNAPAEERHNDHPSLHCCARNLGFQSSKLLSDRSGHHVVNDGDRGGQVYGEPAKFVTVMPYTFTRNPMYVGLTVVLLGLAALFASQAMILAPIIFLVVIDRMVIPREEQTMERLFGAEYLEYKGRVRRWL